MAAVDQSWRSADRQTFAGVGGPLWASGAAWRDSGGRRPRGGNDVAVGPGRDGRPDASPPAAWIARVGRCGPAATAAQKNPKGHRGRLERPEDLGSG